MYIIGAQCWPRPLLLLLRNLARPVIVPETIECDRGKAYISRNFRSACAAAAVVDTRAAGTPAGRLVVGWQNRPHDGLRDPSAPGRPFTPNEKYAALLRSAGYVPMALGSEDYIELLPATWRMIRASGVKINHRKYDDEALGPFGNQNSGVARRKGLWEIHYDRKRSSRQP